MTVSTFAYAPLLAIAGNSALLIFLLYTAAVFALAALSNRLLQKKSFLSEYFLGSRSLGVWAFALTFAATSASGGSFTGFPAKIYTHGWILGLWISSYMVVPICTMGLIGKRINQVARISGSITVPDVIRDRFRSPSLGLIAVSLIVFFMSFNLVGQFKAGSLILVTLLQDVPQFQSAVAWMAGVKSSFAFLQAVDAAYLLCLLGFAVAVIIYTTYGGFHAVVWTDVMQGVVMVFGVMLMLPLALSQVGGLSKATEEMAQMTTPKIGLAHVEAASPVGEEAGITDPWLTLPREGETQEGEESLPRLLRLNGTVVVPESTSDKLEPVIVKDRKFVEITTPLEIRRQLERLKAPAEISRLTEQIRRLKEKQLAWCKQSKDPGATARAAQIESELKQLGSAKSALLNDPAFNAPTVTVALVKDFKYGSDTQGVYVTGPGPSLPALPASSEEAEKETESDAGVDGFLPFALAISFFFMWAISGTGQPSNMVRLMAFRDTPTLRRSICTVAIYYSLIYFPLVMIFCCSRIVLPGMELNPDRIMPQMAVTLTENIGQGWLAGLLVAAPFAAIMSTVDSFLLMISSAVVRDIYQRNINPDATEKSLKRLSYLCTLLIGFGAMMGAINPPDFLQDIIVYTGSGLAACFLGPMIYALYWPRVNKQGTIAGMLAGFGAHFSMYFLGIFVNDSFYKPYKLFEFNPIIIGLFTSFATVYIVSRLTAAPPTDLVRKYFCKKQETPTA